MSGRLGRVGRDVRQVGGELVEQTECRAKAKIQLLRERSKNGKEGETEREMTSNGQEKCETYVPRSAFCLPKGARRRQQTKIMRQATSNLGKQTTPYGRLA